MIPVAEYFTLHLRELRQRLLWSLLAVIGASLIAYLFAEQLTAFFMAPLFQAHPALQTLVYTNLTEAFVSYLKVALLVGVMASFPVCCYQGWMFVSPGLHEHERGLALRVVGWASLLFAGGAAFAYFIVLPAALSFFMSFAGEMLEPLPKLDYYLTFVARLSLAFALAFEIPFLMVAAVKVGLAAEGYFAANRWVYYLGILMLAFLLAGGDFVATGMAALPLFGLYEAGLLFIRFSGISGGKGDMAG